MLYGSTAITLSTQQFQPLAEQPHEIDSSRAIARWLDRLLETEPGRAQQVHRAT